MLTVATWNVNSIKARHDRLLAWLERTGPDVLCLQELKVTNENFPFDELQACGYYSAVLGQKTYNGVAILAREPLVDVRYGLLEDDDTPQARLISAKVFGVRWLSAYFPNGQEVGSDKYAYKLRWMSRLKQQLEQVYKPEEPLALCGDFNVAPHESDAARPERWADSVLCVEPVRHALADIADWGLSDVVRAQHPEGGLFSWWDYRRLAFPKNDGLRIDHIYATASLAERCVAARVDRDERKGQKPSDHAPVLAQFRSAS